MKRRVWVSPYLQRRVQYGHYDTLMHELYNESPELCRNYTRMDRDLFDENFPSVTPQSSLFRKPIDPGLRVGITLRFPARDNTYKSLQYSFRNGTQRHQLYSATDLQRHRQGLRGGVPEFSLNA